MTRAPLVSVVLIFLNAEAFLEEAIESVLAQTWNDWELLLVDDGSTDRSTSIARRYAELQGERITYLEHDGHMNRGKSTSRNLGLQRARGEYVAFLDADDVWLPAKLARQVATLSRNPEAVMLYGPTQYWHSWAPEARQRDFRGVLGVRAGVLYRGSYLLSRYLARTGIVPGICSTLARLKAVVEVGGFEESIQHMFEDQTLIAKLCLHGPVFVDSRDLAPAKPSTLERTTRGGRLSHISPTWNGSQAIWKRSPVRTITCTGNLNASSGFSAIGLPAIRSG